MQTNRRRVYCRKAQFTTSFLVNNADFSAAPIEFEKLKRSAEKIDQFRKLILPARNKLIGHLDLEAAYAEEPLGNAPIEAWRQFWLDLQDFLTILSARFYPTENPFYLNGVSLMSDASALVRAMQESTYFRAIIDDPTLTRAATDIAFASTYYGAQ
jgi:hypothetical protein